jgi:hypothetical protein
MRNQMIGIAGVFALTFFLVALRHFFLSLGRANKGRQGALLAHSRDNELKKVNEKLSEDAWFLWAPEPPEPNDTESSNRAHDELAASRAHTHGTGSSPLR